MRACKNCYCYDVCKIVKSQGEDRDLKRSPCKYYLANETIKAEWIQQRVWKSSFYTYAIYECSHCRRQETKTLKCEWDPNLTAVLELFCASCGRKMSNSGDQGPYIEEE